MLKATKRNAAQASIKMSRGRIHYGGQPLNKKAASRKRAAFFVLVMSSIVVVIQQNHETLSNALIRPVSKVRIESAQQFVTEEELKNLVSRYLGAGFFTFDVLGAKNSLEQHPWIRFVSVKKIWPDTVAIDIREEVAIARWKQGQLLNQFGEIFEPAEIQRLDGLPLLIGPEGAQYRVMEQYRAVSQQLFSAGVRVTSLSLSPRGNWVLVLNDSTRVTLGREKTVERLARFAEFYENPELELHKTLLSADLRYDNGIAVKLEAKESASLAYR